MVHELYNFIDQIGSWVVDFILLFNMFDAIKK